MTIENPSTLKARLSRTDLLRLPHRGGAGLHLAPTRIDACDIAMNDRFRQWRETQDAVVQRDRNDTARQESQDHCLKEPIEHAGRHWNR